MREIKLEKNYRSTSEILSAAGALISHNKARHEKELVYLSWSYDSPLSSERIKKTLWYETNYAFFFDRAECVKYWRKGYGNVYHLPLAVNTGRLDKIKLTEKEKQKYRTEISMVGQLYDAQLEVLMTPLDDYEKGYLTGIIEAQMRLYGCYFLPEVLTEEFLTNTNISYEKDTLKDYFIKLFTHLEKFKIETILIYKADLFNLLKDEFDNRLMTIYKNKYTDYKSYFIAGGIFNVYYYWLKNGCVETPSEIANKLVNLMQK